MVAQLINHAYLMGYQLTFGDAYRDPRATFPYSHPRSLHKSRLAIDLNLFKQDASGRWRYLRSTEAHRPLGEYWESIGGTWGGRDNDDGNHYSIAHGGMT
jgi:hypothetical protein